MCLSLFKKCQVHFYRLVSVTPRKKFDIWTFWTETNSIDYCRGQLCWNQNENLTTFSCGPCSVVNRRPKNTRLDLVVNSLLRTHNEEEGRRRNKTKKIIERPERERAEREREQESLDRFKDLTGGKKKKKIYTHPKTRRDHPSKPTQPMGNKTRTRRTKWRRLSLGKLNLFLSLSKIVIWFVCKSSRKIFISHTTAIFIR